MQHAGTRMLETDRLILRRFSLDDAQEAFACWFSDPQAARYMRWHVHASPEETRTMLAGIVSDYAKENYYRWAIVLKDRGTLVGSIGFYMLNEYDELAYVAYVIGREYWNQGIVSEALKIVLAYAFETVGINRMESSHATANPASGRVMQKAGMTHEGHARQKFKATDGFMDSELYGIVADEWHARYGANAGD